MKISIILGTRPEIIKMSPIIRECERLQLDYFVLHTGQTFKTIALVDTHPFADGADFMSGVIITIEVPGQLAPPG